MLYDKKLPRLLPGLVDKSVEFFVHQNEIKCLHDGQVYYYENIPEWIFDIIDEDMLKYPDAIKALGNWENLSSEDYRRQYIYCRFGGADHEPDIYPDGTVKHTEYFDCGLRGKCRHEGKLCCSIQVENGILTKTELEVLKHINLLDKEIASEMFISLETVSSHLQNIRQKTGLPRKPQLAIFASQKGLI